MAPAPPVFNPNAPYTSDAPAPHLMAFNGAAIPFPSTISLTDPGMPGNDDAYPAVRTALKAEGGGKKCRIQDRFDRGGELIAYQWGRNRVGLDVDGLNMDERKPDGFLLQYRLRLQEHTPKKERCWYDSHWQGLVGSGYNEMFIRKENTVWQQLDEIGDQVDDAWGKLTD